MHDISSAELLEMIRTRGSRGMAVKHLVSALASDGGGRSEIRAALRPLLRRLLSDGQIVLGRGKRYFAVEATDFVSGRLRVAGAGHGVVTPAEGDATPVRIEKAGLRGAVDGDRVLVRLENPRRKARQEGQREGVVVRVLERARRSVVGRWDPGQSPPVVRPVDRRLGFVVSVRELPAGDEPEPGEFVEVSLEQVTRSGRARGRLLERLGASSEPGVIERVTLRSFGIPEEFPAQALAEAEAARLDLAALEREPRWDLRERPLITIDPADARDFDDAVCAAPGRGDAISVEVHIADVSHFVPPGSALDRAARERSTSVYLPGRVVHMLPERLSADLCSLRPEVDRPAFTVRFEVAADGALGKVRARPSLIRSRCRASYDEVARWLELKPADWPAETADFADSLRLCAEAASRLRRHREQRGSLDFDLAEPKLELDDDGRVQDVRPAPRTPAHRMIEELMVAANRAVAGLLLHKDEPALHRVHDRPDPRRLAELAATLEGLGFPVHFEGKSATVAQLQEVLRQAAGRPSERLVSTLVLRSLARAVYSPEPRGHFALAADAYLHFTSPIRRYPDLVAHRALRRALALASPAPLAADDLARLGEHCSEREQRAENAERFAVSWHVMRYLADRVGEVFAGRITGVTDFGLFVQLDEFAVDGLVHVADLGDDYYEHDPTAHRLVGTRRGRSWRLGDELQVRVLRVDEESQQLQLVVVDTESGSGPGRRRAAGRPGRRQPKVKARPQQRRPRKGARKRR